MTTLSAVIASLKMALADALAAKEHQARTQHGNDTMDHHSDKLLEHFGNFHNAPPTSMQYTSQYPDQHPRSSQWVVDCWLLAEEATLSDANKTALHKTCGVSSIELHQAPRLLHSGQLICRNVSANERYPWSTWNFGATNLIYGRRGEVCASLYHAHDRWWCNIVLGEDEIECVLQELYQMTRLQLLSTWLRFSNRD
ncbi:hypothetical protein LTR86_010920 [Recurvomyces mirabilis]|nr:hypothetical protein LTR86_010920 [Recurvomyces mirabilis]